MTFYKAGLATAAAAVCLPLHAMSVQDFEARPVSEQSVYISSFVEKMTGDLGRSNPLLSQNIRYFFTVKPAGKALSPGVERLAVELSALRRVAREGRVDLSKIQVESVIVTIVKERFSPR